MTLKKSALYTHNIHAAPTLMKLNAQKLELDK